MTRTRSPGSARKIASNASIGLSLSSLDYRAPGKIVRDAYIAMYQAKTRGRDRHIVFEKGMHLREVAQLDMEPDLRRAIDNEEFAFQPVVHIHANRTAGFEALVRWNYQDSGFVPSEEFIPIA